MSLLKILLLGIFGIVAVMTITAIIHLIAAYAAFLLVIGFFAIALLLNKDSPEEGEPGDTKDQQS